jgi:HemY protein
MKGLLWLLAAFALAAGLSIALHENEGYVLFVYPPWRIDLSLNFFLILLAAAFVAAYLVVRAIAHTLRLPAYVRAFRIRQGERRAREALAQSLQALYEGRFGRAAKLAAQAHDLGQSRALAALVAARASQRMRNVALRDSWIAKARAAEPEWRQATLAAEAELLLEERRYDDARAVLLEMQAGGARHIATLLALLRAEQGLGNWSEVIRIARVLEKRDAMPREALAGIVVNARVAMLLRKSIDSWSLADYWRSVPAGEQRQARIAGAAARAWMQLGDGSAAQGVIENALAAAWDPGLVLLYGECRDDEAIPRVERAEGWLKEHPQDAELLLTLGRLCAQRELWGKARSYLEASLALHPARDAHVALARLCDRIDLADEANRHYRAASQMSDQT